jgi:hypothetical protein
VKAGDRVKTDRRDALKLARNYRAGELMPVWVPDAAHEALRDLVRAREAAKKDELRARHRLNKFLLRHGRRPPMGVKAWTMKYLEWIKREVHFEQMAQEATLLDYLHEVEHAGARIMRLDGAVAIGRTPDVWAAGVEMYGIINWMTMLEHEDPMLQQYERSLLGDPVKDRAAYDAASPITYIHSVKAPLLVLQGDNDPRVPKEEAEQVLDC